MEKLKEIYEDNKVLVKPVLIIIVVITLIFFGEYSDV